MLRSLAVVDDVGGLAVGQEAGTSSDVPGPSDGRGQRGAAVASDILNDEGRGATNDHENRKTDTAPHEPGLPVELTCRGRHDGDVASARKIREIKRDRV